MMEGLDIQQSIDRIGRMELIFDLLQKVADTNPAALRNNMLLEELLWTLTEYYEGGQWLQDYELDEQGLLPQNLKRGVLSQDGVNNLLEKLREEAEKNK